jgi:HD domain
MAALSLATDLGIGVPIEHGLRSTLLAMRLADHLGVDSATATQIYYACLLFYVGCTADAEVAAETFGDDDALARHGLPARFGSRSELLAGLMRALADPGSPAPLRVAQMAGGLPRAAREYKGHVTAFCEVAQMLGGRLGLPPSMQGLFAFLVERWDGKGLPGGARGEEIPLPVRIASVARDAAFQRDSAASSWPPEWSASGPGARSTPTWPSRSPTRPASSWPWRPMPRPGRRRWPASLAPG